MADNGYPQAVNDLIELFKAFPGVGRRSAERMVLAMLDWPPEKLAALAGQLKELPEKVGACEECGNLAEAGEKCQICKALNRDRSLICVVETPTQIQNIEASALFRGVYHVLGGKLSPLEGKDADSLNIHALLTRIGSGEVKEIIMALSPDVEGQATGIYIAELLKDKGVKISRLAQGLPAGSDISYADSATIAAALSGRISL